MADVEIVKDEKNSWFMVKREETIFASCRSYELAKVVKDFLDSKIKQGIRLPYE